MMDSLLTSEVLSARTNHQQFLSRSIRTQVARSQVGLAETPKLKYFLPVEHGFSEILKNTSLTSTSVLLT